jgi:hypothetical protein
MEKGSSVGSPSPAALMKLRRFQKSDSSVILELGMSEGRRISMTFSAVGNRKQRATLKIRRGRIRFPGTDREGFEPSIRF